MAPESRGAIARIWMGYEGFNEAGAFLAPENLLQAGDGAGWKVSFNEAGAFLAPESM